MPYTGTVGAAESIGDEYIPLSLRWPREGSALILHVRDGEGAILEMWFDGAGHSSTRRLVKLTLVTLPDTRYFALAAPLATVPVLPGLPRCDPAPWLAATRTGSFNGYGDCHLFVTAGVRLGISPVEAVLFIDGLAGDVEMELASGRARIGVDARGAIAYVRLTRPTAREAALLEEHRTPA